MPEIQASYGSRASKSGSTLRMWQQRSGSRSQRFGPSRRCCSATVITCGVISSMPYRSTNASLVSYVSRKKSCVSSSTIGTSSPSSETMCTSTDDCFCHEQVRQSLSPNSPYAQRRTSSACIASVSGTCRLGVAKQDLLECVAAQAEPQRLEQNGFVGRDVPEVHVRAEVLDEPRLGRLRRGFEDQVIDRDLVRDLLEQTRTHVAVGAEDPGGAA